MAPRPRARSSLAGCLPSPHLRRHGRRMANSKVSERLGHRHCEERSDEAIHSSFARRDGLLRFARNDGSNVLVSWLIEKFEAVCLLAKRSLISLHKPYPSCPDLIRASIIFAKSFPRRWITGSSPVMTISIGMSVLARTDLSNWERVERRSNYSAIAPSTNPAGSAQNSRMTL